MTRPALAALLLTACAGAPAITADVPDRSDAPPRIQVRGAEPGAAVRLTTERPSDWDASQLVRSVLTYEADERGRVDTARDAPTGLDAPDPYAPFWMAASTEDAAPEGATPSDAVIRADLDGDGQDDLTADATLPLGHRTVTEQPFDPAFPGAFIMRPEGTEGERLPVIVALGGSSGGDGAARFIAPRLASLGYAVLGLPYYAPAWFGREAQFPELPSDFVDLPVDFVEAGIAALREREDIDPDRVGLHGVSKGGELVLLAASLIPDDSPGGGYCAVAAIVPSDVVWEGWGASSDDELGSSGFSWRGEALPFVPYKDIGRALNPSAPDAVAMRVPHDEGRAANPTRVPAAMIDVGAIGEPVFALGGDADTVWDSGGMTRNIAARRGALPTVALAYEEADHGLSGTAYRRATPGTAAARADAWPKMAAFLGEHMSEAGCEDARVPAPTASAAEAAYRRVDAGWFERDLPDGSVAAALRAVMHAEADGPDRLAEATASLPESPVRERLAEIAVTELEAAYRWADAATAAARLGRPDLADPFGAAYAGWPAFQARPGGPQVIEVPFDDRRFPARVDGRDVTVLLDTGAPNVGVRSDLASRVDRTITATSVVPAYGLSFPKHPALIGELEIGGAVLRDVPANTAGAIPPEQRDAFERLSADSAEVFMGLDPLRQAFDVVELDYDAGVMRLIRRDPEPDAAPNYVHGSGLKPVMRLERSGEAVNVFLDTGSYGHLLGPDAVPDPACLPSRTFDSEWGSFTEYLLPVRLGGAGPYEVWASRRRFAEDAAWDVTGVFGIPYAGTLRIDVDDRRAELRGYDPARSGYHYEPTSTSPGEACEAAEGG